MPAVPLVGLEGAECIPESVALLAVTDPDHHSAALIKDGNYIHGSLRIELKKDRLRSALFTGITEKDGEICHTIIYTTFPGIFGRGLARVRRREPSAIANIEHLDLMAESGGSEF